MTCAICHQPLRVIDGHRQQRYCSRDRQTIGMRVSRPEDREPSPLHWDGRRTYSAQGAPREPYRVVCLSSGHLGGTYMLTRAQAVLVSRAGLSHCDLCRSYRYLEPEYEMPHRTSAVKTHQVSGLGTLP